MGKTLLLQKRGCDFWSDEPYKSDINNYRVTTTDEIIKGKDGNTYFLEFTLWRNKGHYRKTTKNGKRELKNAVWEIDAQNTICVGTQFTNDNGCWRNSKLEKVLNDKNLLYTQKNILKLVNSFSIDKYDKIEFV